MKTSKSSFYGVTRLKLKHLGTHVKDRKDLIWRVTVCEVMLSAAQNNTLKPFVGQRRFTERAVSHLEPFFGSSLIVLGNCRRQPTAPAAPLGERLLSHACAAPPQFCAAVTEATTQRVTRRKAECFKEGVHKVYFFVFFQAFGLKVKNLAILYFLSTPASKPQTYRMYLICLLQLRFP